MIPCYNSASTLARALTSLLVQSHKEWEALVIDDGSSDHPEEVIRKINDPRIRLIRHPQNRGRPQARQTALENITGQLLTMLDADDWLMPDKLKIQVEFLAAHPEIALVSTAMYLTSSHGELAGVARFGLDKGSKISGPLNFPRPLPLAHAPLMVRVGALADRKYDTRLKFSEDLDFFLPVLLQNFYAVLAEPLYVYSFEQNKSVPRLREQLASHRLIFKKYIGSYPFRAGWKIISTFPKSWIAGIVKPWLRQRGVSAATPIEADRYSKAYELVDGATRERLPDPTHA